MLTYAALAGLPARWLLHGCRHRRQAEWKIRSRSRHKTAELVARYVRAAEEWTDSGLKGVGF